MEYLIRCWLVIGLLVSCGHKDGVSPAPVTHIVLDINDHPLHGWPSLDDCDGLLWAGLSLAAGGDADLSEAEKAPGELHRRPGTECYPGESASTISGDMIIGYLWGMWCTKNLPALQRLADYGLAHNWVMGEGPASRTVMRYNDYVLLAKMIYILSNGADVRRFYQLEPVYFDVTADYEEHLQVLSILLYTEVYGKIDTASFNRLTQLCTDNPNDALFQAACGLFSGVQTKAISLLTAPEVSYPTYVRGAETYKDVYWRFAARIVTGVAQ